MRSWFLRRLLSVNFALLAWCSSVCLAAEKWQVQYFYDENKSSLILQDIKFCSAERGVAVGAIVDKRNSVKPVALVTTDGGKKWVTVETKEVGLSLFFLNETAGWMVTPKGIWFTDEAGRSWRRIRKDSDLLRVYFLDQMHGYAVGARKRVIETVDGGKTWKPLVAADDLKTSAERTTFSAIGFAGGKVGVIAGRSKAVRRQRVPDWLESDPQRERPSLSVFLETKNGGQKWEEKTSSMFGRISQLSFHPAGRGLALLEFDQLFEYPSEIYRLNLGAGTTERSLRRQSLALTDVALLSGNGLAFAAGFEAPGLIARSPIPGKLRVLRSPDSVDWYDMDVDYRAVASRVSIGAWDAEHVWIATDTGMILRLTSN